MNLISQISPVTDAEAAGLVQAGTFGALATEITSLPPASGLSRPAGAGRAGRPGRTRKRVLLGVPVAAALAIAGLIATSAGGPGQRVGPVSVGPARAQAAVLSITRHGRYLDVIVRNPVADPAKYRAEFARYHLDISLRLVPVSPSIVGTVVYAAYPQAEAKEITIITARGKCFTGGGGSACPVGIRVSADFRGAATLVFGRAARPGERYESTAAATAPGEAMHGLHFVGRPVSEVLAMLAERGVTVPQWLVARGNLCETKSVRTVPGDWYVDQADPWAPGQVVLGASRTWPAPACEPAPGSPVATPSPTAHSSAAAG